MPKTRSTAGISGLGTITEIRRLAEANYAPPMRPKVNTHIHLPPNFSAFTSVAQAVELAGQQGVSVLGASNYYDFGIYKDLADLARRRGIFPLFGLEVVCMNDGLRAAGIKVNDPGNPGKTYLCGKGITRFTRLNPTARRLLDMVRDNDSARMARMIAAAERVFAQRGLPTGLTAQRVVEGIVRRHGSPRSTVYVQERHVAQAFQEAAFAMLPAGERIARLSHVCGTQLKAAADDAVGVQNELRSHLLKAGKPAFMDEMFLDLPQALQLILALGGIPCYPVLADGSTPICPFEDPVEQLIANVKGLGLHAAEFIPIRNDVEVLTRYVTALRRAGLVVTAGTEHNTLDLIALEPACRGGRPIPEELQALFWEGACVVAAHQFLTARGAAGFVDAQGRPHPGYADADSRIAAFARLGAAVIGKYQVLNPPES